MSSSSPVIKKGVEIQRLSPLDLIRKVWNNLGGAFMAPLNLLPVQTPGALAGANPLTWFVPFHEQKHWATSAANSFNKHCFLLQIALLSFVSLSPKTCLTLSPKSPCRHKNSQQRAKSTNFSERTLISGISGPGEIAAIHHCGVGKPASIITMTTAIRGEEKRCRPSAGERALLPHSAEAYRNLTLKTVAPTSGLSSDSLLPTLLPSTAAKAEALVLRPDLPWLKVSKLYSSIAPPLQHRIHSIPTRFLWRFRLYM